MEKQSFVIERVYEAPVSNVWKAITQVGFLKQWYYDLPEFRPEVGFEFRFESNGQCEVGKIHLCKITEVVKEKKLAYTWRWEGYEGSSLVSMELEGQGRKTKLRLKHEGLETFAAELLEKKDIAGGWTWLIGTSLDNFLQRPLDYRASITVAVTPREAFDGINRVSEWWTKNLDGSSAEPGDVFTLNFGDTFVTMKIVESVPERKVVWQVTDCFLHFIQDKREWLDTKVVFELAPEKDGTTILMTHEGLTPQVECYDNCEKGWDFYVRHSLRQLLTEKKGMPDTSGAARKEVLNS